MARTARRYTWDDAVGKAIDRYGIVMENYAAGKYAEHRNPTDNLFRLESAFDEMLSEVKKRITKG